MYKCLFSILLIISLNAFSQHSKKKIKQQLGQGIKEVSHEHFKDFKLITDMLDSAKKVSYLRYNMKSVERIESGYATASTIVKLQCHPRKSYLVNTQNKLEVLYNESELGNKALVKPHVFPYFTMSLEPLGNIMRKNQHHTIHDLGFAYIAKTTRASIFKAGIPLEKIFTYIGDITWDNTECYKLFASYPDFKYINYKVEKGETIASIAAEFNCGEYRILEKNTWIKEYTANIEGKQLLVPNNYSNKTILYVTKKTNLPVFLKVYDDLGFYESYEYHNLQVNTSFAANEFSKNYSEYHF